MKWVELMLREVEIRLGPRDVAPGRATVHAIPQPTFGPRGPRGGCRMASAKRVEGIDYSAFVAHELYVGNISQWFAGWRGTAQAPRASLDRNSSMEDVFACLRRPEDIVPGVQKETGWVVNGIVLLSFAHPGVPFALVVENKSDRVLPFAVDLVGRYVSGPDDRTWE